MTDPDQNSLESPPSKTQLKQAATRLQKLGARLTTLTSEQLAEFDLPERLAKAIADHQRFKSRNAKRRQLQYIGKVMRDVDASPIEAKFLDMDGESSHAQFVFNQSEQWRARLLADAQDLTAFVDSYPNVDRQQLRQVLQRAVKGLSHGSDQRQPSKLIRMQQTTTIKRLKTSRYQI